MIFIGPLPPPVGGFSVITAEMLASLKRASLELLVIDRSRRAGKMIGANALRLLFTTATQLYRLLMVCRTGKHGAMYVALSGGSGQWIDLIFMLLGKHFGLQIFVHHHSFAYLTDRSNRTARLLRIIPSAVHITLCGQMAAGLVEKYGVGRDRTVILSNAAFVTACRAEEERRPSTELRIGFLGNITREKGIFEFFDVLDELRRRGRDVLGFVGGPVAPEIADEFSERLRRTKGIHHFGPVYGQQKRDFFYTIDLLLFPSNYINEAEPVTILEALSANVYVISTPRGCCNDLLVDSLGGGAVVSFETFIAGAAGHILEWDAVLRGKSPSFPLEHFIGLHDRASASLHKLIAQMKVADQSIAGRIGHG